MEPQPWKTIPLSEILTEPQLRHCINLVWENPGHQQKNRLVDYFKSQPEILRRMEHRELLPEFFAYNLIYLFGRN